MVWAPGSPGKACSQPAQRRRILVCTSVVAAVLLLWPWLSLVTSAAYSYVWWLRPEVHWSPSPADVPANGTQLVSGVPKVLHQTWQTAEVPAKWAAARQSCIDLHPDYEHRLWTDADGLQFITEHYAWFLPTYLSYTYNIQRVDVLRYFILLHHGGIYIDLDMGCKQRLDFMRAANFTAPMTHPVGISNDVMAAAPGSAYLDFAVKRLRHWNRWLGFQYVQVMFCSGPMFLTIMYSFFPARSDVAIISKPLYGKYDLTGNAAFYHLHGSSWHEDDAAFIFWLDRHKMTLVVIVGVLTAGAAGTALLRWAWQHPRYRQLKSEE